MNTIYPLQRKFGILAPILENTIILVFIKGLTGIARAILFLLIAKKFGLHDFGRFSLVYSFVELFKMGSDIGVDTVLIRRFSADQEGSQSLLGHSLILKIMLATAGYITSLLGFSLFYPNFEGTALLLILSLSIYTSLLTNLFNVYFQASLEMVEILPGHMISAILYIALTLLGLYQGWPLAALVLIIPLTEGINLLVTYRIYRQKASLKLRLNRRIIQLLLKESFPVGLSVLMIVLYMRMDIFLLGWYQEARAVGEYAAAFRITEPFMLIFSSLSLSLYASFSKPSVQLQRTETKRMILNVLGITLLSSLGLAVLLSLFSRDLMSYFTDQYHDSAEVLMILSGAIIFKALNTQLTAMIHSQGKYSVITRIALTNLFINIAMGLFLIPRYGSVGAAISVVITEAINTAIQSFCLSRFLRKAAIA
jgi:O-antigen/teichoic acid export membrane protein